MKSFYFTKSLEAEEITELIKFINENESKITIYLMSSGGNTWDTTVLLDMFEKNKDRITLIANGYIYSNAFRLFFKFTGKREILPKTRGLTHQCYQKLTINESGAPQSTEDIASQKDIKTYYKDSLEWHEKLGLTKTEMRKFRQGQDIYFTEERLREFLKNQS